MKTLPYIPEARIHMRDFKLQTVDERARIVESWTRFAVGCFFVSAFAVAFVWMLVRAA